MASMKPEMNQNITIMQALAPVAFMGNIRSPLIGMARSLSQMNPNKAFELLPHTYALYSICSSNKILEISCIQGLYQIMGQDNNSVNRV